MRLFSKQNKSNIPLLLTIFVLTGIILTLAAPHQGRSYWDHHGMILLIFLTLTPRLALLVSSIPFGGFLWWIGFIFCPRYLIAILATLNYWQTNPFLVSFAWFIALGGEASEKVYIRRRFATAQRPANSNEQIIDIEPLP